MAYVTGQEYVARVVRNPTILTNGYVAGYILGVARTDLNNTVLIEDVDQFNFLALECDFTVGSLTSVAIKVEFSDDNTNWFVPVKGAFTGGIDAPVQAFFSLTLTGLYYININTELFSGGQFKAKFIRVSASGVGTVTSSSLKITALLGTT